MSEPEEEISDVKVTLFGEGCPGKSNICIRLVSNLFTDKYEPTIEDTYNTKRLQGKKMIFFDLIDTGSSFSFFGDDEGNAYFKKLVNSSNGFLLVYSVENRVFFETGVRQYFNEIRALKPSAPIILIANKIDLPKEEHEVTKEEGEQLAKSLGIPFYEVSAKQDKNVKEPIDHILKNIIKSSGSKLNVKKLKRTGSKLKQLKKVFSSNSKESIMS